MCALVAAGCGSGTHGPSSAPGTTPHAAAPATSTARPAAARPARAVRLGLVGTRSLPAPVQLPGLARVGTAVLAAGGLDRADTSTSDIVRAGPGAPRRVGALPAAVHDVGAAALGGRLYVFGGGSAAGPTDRITAVTPGGPRRAPSDGCRWRCRTATAVTLGGTVYVIGGDAVSGALRSVLRLPAGACPAAGRDAAARAALRGGRRRRRAPARRRRHGRDHRPRRDPQRRPPPPSRAGDRPAPGPAGPRGGRRARPDASTSSAAAATRPTASAARSGRSARTARPAGRAAAGRAVGPERGRLGRTAPRRRRPRPARGRARRGLRPGAARDRARRSGAAPAGTRTAVRAAARPVRPGLIPRPLDRRDVYAADRPGALSPVVRRDPPRVYVPNSVSNTVDVIDQRTARVVRRFAVGTQPQHVTPSWDLRTLWVTNDVGNSLTPIDPRTGRPGRPGPGRRPVQPLLHGRRPARDRRRRGASRARLPHPAHDAAAPGACASRAAPASTTWTSPPTGAARSSRASSPAAWSSSTCGASASGERSRCAAGRCRRTSSSRPTDGRSTSPTWRPAACG